LPDWIINASPLIGLVKINRLALLSRPERRLFLPEGVAREPEGVAREVAAGPPDDPACQALQDLDKWDIQRLPATLRDARLSPFSLDAGEAAVLSAALARPGSRAILDDGPGRRAAMALGVSVTGTLGVLILAHDQGRIDALAPELRGLQDAGLYLPSEDFLRGLLAQKGEAWP